MQLVIVLIAVAVIGAAALVAAGWFGQQQADPVRDVYQPPLDEDRVRADDLESVRFGVTPMGYDMGQVDEWMARVARELDRRERAAGSVPDAPSPFDPSTNDAASGASAVTSRRPVHDAE